MFVGGYQIIADSNLIFQDWIFSLSRLSSCTTGVKDVSVTLSCTTAVWVYWRQPTMAPQAPLHCTYNLYCMYRVLIISAKTYSREKRVFRRIYSTHLYYVLCYIYKCTHSHTPKKHGLRECKKLLTFCLNKYFLEIKVLCLMI